jgi:hypothetical protein
MPLKVISFSANQVLLGEPGVVLRELADQRGGDRRDVTCRGQVLRVGQAGAVDEVAPGHAEPSRVAVHQRREGRLVAGDVLGQRDAGIVAGLDDHPLEQRLDVDLLADLDEHPRALHAPRLLADGDLVGQRQVAGADLVQHRVDGHDLGDAGRLDRVVDALLGQHVAAVHVLQQPAAGTELRW